MNMIFLIKKEEESKIYLKEKSYQYNSFVDTVIFHCIHSHIYIYIYIYKQSYNHEDILTYLAFLYHWVGWIFLLEELIWM